MSGDVAYTCETAGHFFLYQVHSRWEQFVAKVKPLAGKVCVLGRLKGVKGFLVTAEITIYVCLGLA